MAKKTTVNKPVLPTSESVVITQSFKKKFYEGLSKAAVAEGCDSVQALVRQVITKYLRSNGYVTSEISD